MKMQKKKTTYATEIEQVDLKVISWLVSVMKCDQLEIYSILFKKKIHMHGMKSRAPFLKS